SCSHPGRAASVAHFLNREASGGGGDRRSVRNFDSSLWSWADASFSIMASIALRFWSHPSFPIIGSSGMTRSRGINKDTNSKTGASAAQARRSQASTSAAFSHVRPLRSVGILLLVTVNPSSETSHLYVALTLKRTFVPIAYGV